MQKIEHLRIKNIISDKDIVIYLFIKTNEYKTAVELSKLCNRDYTGVTQSIKTLLDNDLISNTIDKPKKYYIKND